MPRNCKVSPQALGSKSARQQLDRRNCRITCIAASAALAGLFIYPLPLLGTSLATLAASAHSAPDVTSNMIDRSRKGDFLASFVNRFGPANVAISKSAIANRQGADVHNYESDRIPMQPGTNTTFVTKRVAPGTMTIGSGGRALFERNRVDRTRESKSDKRVLDGCDPAFSPLVASAHVNFSGRCVASTETPLRLAALQ